ncbi:MAG: hypothetical protein GY862_33570 [Gammaproteobacteria bacterium]|nr:hypothetical protein [Gammaproteobacteria bacterium]
MYYFLRLLCFCGLIIFSTQALPVYAELKAYTDNIADETPAVLQDIDTASGQASVPPEYAQCNSPTPNTVFSVGFSSGLAYIGDVLYGLGWDNENIYLYTMAASYCAEGIRVGGAVTGFANLEGLTWCADDETLYSVDFDFGAHAGRLIRIDPATGLGEVAGELMARDLKVTGLACDPIAKILYAVTHGHGTRAPELLTIDRVTGTAAVIGGTGTEALESLALDASVTPSRLLAAGTALYAIAPDTGAAALIGNNSTGATVWGMAFHHAPTPEAPLLDVNIEGADVSASWNTVAGAEGYTLFYAPYSNPVSSATLDNIASLDLGADTSIAATLPAGTEFYIAVQSYNGSGSSGYSNVGVIIIP